MEAGSHSNNIQELNLDHRYSVARKWALASKDVANESGVQEVLDVWNFLDENTGLGVPIPNESIQTFFTVKPSRPLDEYAFLTPVIHDDSKRLPADDFRMSYAVGNPPFVAQFRQGSRAIYFSEEILSRRGQGIILLHEARHAKNDIERTYDRNDPQSHWIEEAEVYLMEFKIMAGVCGKDYGELVEECTRQMLPDETGVQLAKVEQLKSGLLWRKVFGAGISNRELKLWDYVAGLNAFWQFLQTHSSEPIQELADYLKKSQPRP